MSKSWVQVHWLVCLLLTSTLGLFAQEKLPTYSIVEIALANKSDIAILEDLGIAADHVHWHNGTNAELFLSDRELGILNANGFEFEYVIRDTKAHADKLAKETKNANYKNEDCGLKEFTLGSVAGYKDYQEVKQRLNEIVLAYPEITQLEILGESHEGRDIVALKISDNVARDESLFEGTAYYDALTHAREPLSMMSTLFYIEWLLENYDNPKTIAKYLIDNREMHFILVVNPDGYVYNTTNFPNGGGGWRKNRKVINDNCIGVDLNRNFDAKYDGPGSHSNDPCSAVYRGEAVNSEVETQIIMDYIDRIKPAIAFSSHSYSNVMLDPLSVHSPEAYPDYDFDVYANFGSEFTPKEYHGYGPADHLIGYEASGTTLAYLYESGAIAWTPEIGTQFWEPRVKICECVQEMLEPMKFISKVAGSAPSYHHHYVAENSFVINGETIDLIIGIKDKGLRSAVSTFNAILSSSNSGVFITNPVYSFVPRKDNEVLYNLATPFSIEIFDVDVDSPIEFELSIFDGEIFVSRSSFEIHPGSQKILFEEDFEDGLDKWIQSNELQRWTTTATDAVSGKYALVDSKEFHDDLTWSAITYSEPINLENAIRPFLFYKVKHSFSPREARAVLYLSESSSTVDVGNGNVVSESYTGHSYWKQEAVDLTYAAQNFGPFFLKLLVEVFTNKITDGLYIDDIRIVDLGLDNTTSTSTRDIDPLQIAAYPNPTSNLINIQTEVIEGFSNIEVFNSIGQSMSNRNYPKGTQKTQIDLSSYVSGNYFIKTHSPQGVNLKKISKI